MNLHRRDFLKLGASAACAGALAPRFVFGANAGQRDVLVCIFQRGGMDGLNAIVPYADARYRSLRPTIGIPEPGPGASAAIDLDGFFGLNPAAAPFKALYDAGELAIVHATGGLHGDLSHFTAQSLMERGCLAHQSISTGWLNRHLEVIGNTVPFQAVGIGKAVAPALRGDAPAIGMSSIDSVALTTRSRRALATPGLLQTLYAGSADLDRAAQQAFEAIDVLDLADPGQFDVENGAVYPDTPFGDQLREVAQLIKSGVGLEIACVDLGGWDHHNQLNADLAPLLQELSEGLAALRKDLGARMANVCVLSMTEFGRRAYENGSAGTDHGIGGAMFVLGGGVVGGQVYADWPGLADSQLLDGNLSITIDYRTVLSELLAKRMGNAERTEVFPEFTDAGQLGIFRAR
jgi:uncharacterized protein (DUF1501 family)